MTEIGVNPNQAVAAGSTAETVAGTFTGLINEFQSVVTSARQTAVEPPFQRGFDPFAEDNASAMARVQKHGEAIGGNVQAGGAAGAGTDQRTGGEYSGVAGLLRMRINQTAGDG